MAVKSYRLSDGRTTELVAPSRNLQTVAVGSGGSVLAVESGRMHAAGNAVSAEAVRRFRASITDFCISATAARAQLCPLGTDGMRLSVAIGFARTATACCSSPRIRDLYLQSRRQQPQASGMALRPVWYDNSTVVGMRTANNGVVTTEGHIIATAADGSASRTLTEDNLIAVLPSATRADFLHHDRGRNVYRER